MIRTSFAQQNRSGKIAEWSPVVWFFLSAIICFGLFWGALSIYSVGKGNQRLVVRVYCASAVVDPMSRIVDQFNFSKLAKSEGIVVDIVRTGGSGALAGQISMETLTEVQLAADVFVCSDSIRMADLVEQNVIKDCFRIATQYPVIAVRENSDLNLTHVTGLQSLLSLDVKLGIGSMTSAIGFETARIANIDDSHKLLQTRKSAEFENVMSLVQALSIGSIDAAVVWDSTVHQFNQKNNRPIKIVAYLNSGASAAGSIVQNPLENESLTTKNLPFADRSDKFSLAKPAVSTGSRCFVQVGRSKSTSDQADLFFKFLKNNRNQVLADFFDAGFSNCQSEPSQDNGR